MPRRSTVLLVSILSLYFVLHTALARSRWSPHSGFWLIVLRGTKQLYFHFIGLFSETISGQRSTVLDLKKEKKKPTLFLWLELTRQASCAVKWLFWKKFFFFFKFVFSECTFTCVFICLFICQFTFFILLFFSAEYFSRF